MAVDDARAVEVVGRDLHAHAVARQDPDAEPPHLAGDVTEHLVAVVELHAEHRVRERLDDLPLELDLLFLRQGLDPQIVRTFVACAPFGLSPGVMNPNPFSSLNHFTTPVSIWCSTSAA